MKPQTVDVHITCRACLVRGQVVRAGDVVGATPLEALALIEGGRGRLLDAHDMALLRAARQREVLEQLRLVRRTPSVPDFDPMWSPMR